MANCKNIYLSTLQDQEMESRSWTSQRDIRNQQTSIKSKYNVNKYIAVWCNESASESFVPFDEWETHYDWLCNFVEAVRRNKKVGVITLEHFEAAVDRQYRAARSVEQCVDDDDGRGLGHWTRSLSR